MWIAPSTASRGLGRASGALVALGGFRVRGFRGFRVQGSRGSGFQRALGAIQAEDQLPPGGPLGCPPIGS